MISRGEIVWVNLSPARGFEQDKLRPCVVISNDAANRSAVRHPRGVVTVIPLTSARTMPLDHQVAIPAGDSGLGVDSVAQIEQLRAVDVTRIQPTGRKLNDVLMSSIAEKVSVHLQL